MSSCARAFIPAKPAKIYNIRARNDTSGEKEKSYPLRSIIKLGGSTRAGNKSRTLRQLPGKQSSTQRTGGGCTPRPSFSKFKVLIDESVTPTPRGWEGSLTCHFQMHGNYYECNQGGSSNYKAGDLKLTEIILNSIARKSFAVKRLGMTGNSI